MWMGLNVKNVLAVDPLTQIKVCFFTWHKSILFYEDKTVVRENPDFTLHNYKLPNLILFCPQTKMRERLCFHRRTVILFTYFLKFCFFWLVDLVSVGGFYSWKAPPPYGNERPVRIPTVHVHFIVFSVRCCFQYWRTNIKVGKAFRTW